MESSVARIANSRNTTTNNHIRTATYSQISQRKASTRRHADRRVPIQSKRGSLNIGTVINEMSRGIEADLSTNREAARRTDIPKEAASAIEG
jgi:hypothetical protein